MTIMHRSQALTSVERDAWLEVDLLKIEKNFLKLKDIIKTNIMAVIKADAYGLGSTAIAPLLQSLGVHSFGVATVDEGVALRNAGIKNPILILGATPFWSYDQCLKNNLSITVYSFEQVAFLEKFSKKIKTSFSIHLKLDTGMNRLGVKNQDLEKTIKYILSLKNITLQGVFSHLSDAKDLDFSKSQKERFDLALSEINKLENQPSLLKHLANSFASVNYPDFRYDLVRIGIGITGEEFDFLEPVVSVKGRITRIQMIPKGDYVSYDRTWRADRDSFVATIPIGYADGIDRKLSNKINGIYNGKYIKQIGNITMDQMMFDVTDVIDYKVGDVITLLGKENNFECTLCNWAKTLDTITWELLCRLKLRLPRIYTRD